MAGQGGTAAGQGGTAAGQGDTVVDQRGGWAVTGPPKPSFDALIFLDKNDWRSSIMKEDH